MNFFNQKSGSTSNLNFFEALEKGFFAQDDNRIRKHMAEYERRNRNNGFDPLLDDSLPDDYVFNGWGGLDDDE